MKNSIIASVSVLLAIIISLLAFLPIDGYLAGEGGSDWMAELDDQTPISSLSIPGSHDSGALHSIADLSGKCQTLPIKDQLGIGVRFLDVRLRLVNDELTVVHSFVDQKTLFWDLLYDIEAFLSDHPGEFIIMSIKEDNDPVGSYMNFADAVKEELLYVEECVSFANELPKTLGEARGRIHIMSRYDMDFGVPVFEGWEDDATFTLGSFLIQDNYRITDVDEKLNDIKKTADEAASGNYALVINFASCYLDGAFPPTYSGTAAKKINREIEEYFKEGSGPLGIIVLDYVNEDLVRSVYERSFG